jgi:2-polyprenyl-6-methoxyphenol hydroxylase-like FAD-dependent oxidoreductase
MQAVNSIVIVGAGTAGWLTALVLGTYCPFLQVKLIRPRSHSPIGVGESTQPDIFRVLTAAGIDVKEFYKACDATMKCGIFYEDWNAIGEHYWHPFSNLVFAGSYTPAHHYQQLILEDPARYCYSDYYAVVHTSYDTCIRQMKVAPEAAAALHLDANKITQYLQRVLTRVQVLEADSTEVKTSDGRVSGIVLDGGDTVTGDLYVDCTGFSRALLSRVGTPDVIPYQADVNRAVVAQLPYVDPASEVTPYTRAQAHEHGWTWSIPLQTRIGSGYVYHGDFCSSEQAERNFRAYWGEERMRDINVRHISFDSICLRNPWVENVVAIGLSAGFVEPVEATGLSWTIASADVLSQYLRTRYYDADVSAKYNANMLGYIHDVQDFIDAHYLLSARRDSEFWRYQTSRPYPDRLMHRLALYAEEMPNDYNRVKTSPWAFNEVSWLDILNGYRFRYRKLAINPAQKAKAQEVLQQIIMSPSQGYDPRTCAPAPERAQDPRLHARV